MEVCSGWVCWSNYKFTIVIKLKEQRKFPKCIFIVQWKTINEITFLTESKFVGAVVKTSGTISEDLNCVGTSSAMAIPQTQIRTAVGISQNKFFLLNKLINFFLYTWVVLRFSKGLHD